MRAIAELVVIVSGLLSIFGFTWKVALKDKFLPPAKRESHAEYQERKRRELQELDDLNKNINAYGLDMELQKRNNPNLDLTKRCDGLDGVLPCSKPKGHTGPHYFAH